VQWLKWQSACLYVPSPEFDPQNHHQQQQNKPSAADISGRIIAQAKSPRSYLKNKITKAKQRLEMG
jgi:hypothetical protein